MVNTSLATQIENLKIISDRINNKEWAPFIQTHRSLNERCKFLILKKVKGWMGWYGSRYPYCTNPDVMILFAKDQRRPLTCKGCSYCEDDN